MENLKSKRIETSEELFGLVLENGSSRNLEQVKEECEEIKKLCTIEGRESLTLSNLRVAMTRYRMMSGMPINERKKMVQGMILTHALCLEFASNQEIDYEKMFYATDKIASVVNMKVNFTAEEEEAFRKGILVLLELQTYEKTRVK